MATSPNQKSHIVVCPSAGIGHLNPFLRLTSLLSSNTSFKLTLVVIRPTLAAIEAEHISAFITTHPHVHLYEFHTLPCDYDPTLSQNADPFQQKYWAMCRSAYRLTDHITSLSPSPCAVISDIMLASGLNKALAELSIPNFNLITTSARFFSFMACLPFLKDDENEVSNPIPTDEIQGGAIQFNRNAPFLRLMDTNYRCMRHARGIIVNTFDYLDQKTIIALRGGGDADEVLSDVPQVFPLGPLRPIDQAKEGTSEAYLPWLDGKPLNSVVYVSFGSRTATNRDEMLSLADGLEKSGVAFLWVIKTSIVDKEDKEELKNLLGEGFLERTKDRGLVWNGWVFQEEILAHPSVGGFVSHGGWNSVTEAAFHGVPMLVWPGQDEQRTNAIVVVKAGLGIWDCEWGYRSQKVVTGDQIAEKITELMTTKSLRESAKRVGDEAKKAWESDGSSSQALQRLIDKFN